MTTSRGPSVSFAAGAGNWAGGPEVYDGDGQFAGYGRDTRTVTPHGDGTVHVDVAFDGPFAFAGTYTIVDTGTRRRYAGPLNVGLAEPLGSFAVDAHNHWPQLGLTQRFLLMVLPDGQRQLSLALLNRGERLVWAVVGENRKDGAVTEAMDPAARPADLLFRPGAWEGTVQVLDRDLQSAGEVSMTETYEQGGVVGLSGSPFDERTLAVHWERDPTSAWTGAGPVAGSLSLFGGRALAGSLLHHEVELRCWRREVVATDGLTKAVAHLWFRGGERVGATVGSLEFRCR